MNRALAYWAVGLCVVGAAFILGHRSTPAEVAPQSPTTSPPRVELTRPTPPRPPPPVAPAAPAASEAAAPTEGSHQRNLFDPRQLHEYLSKDLRLSEAQVAAVEQLRADLKLRELPIIDSPPSDDRTKAIHELAAEERRTLSEIMGADAYEQLSWQEETRARISFDEWKARRAPL